VRAESRFEICRHRAHDSAGRASGNDAEWQGEYERRADGQRQSGERGGEAAGGELALAADVEESGAEA